MNTRLCSQKTIHRAGLLLCACGFATGPSVRAEVTPVPPTSLSNLPPGSPVPAVPVAASTKPVVATLPRPAAMTAAIKTAATLAPAQVTALNAYVTTSFTRLMSDDAAAIEQARADLITAVAAPAPGTPCSAPYLTQYLTTFVPQMQAIVGKAPLPKRVNAAIVLTRVFDNLNTAGAGAGVPVANLHPLILAELSDKSEAVALWGMKAASQAVAASPAAPPPKIFDAIVPSVQAHALNGPVTEEAYDALNRPTPAGIKATLALYKLRVAAYANGALPPDASVDRRAASHLTANAMWSVMSPADQVAVMDLIRQNLSSASAAIVAAGATPEAIHDLRILITDDCKAVFVATLGNPAQGPLHIDSGIAAKMGESDPPSQVVSKAAPVITGLQQAYPTGNAGGALPGGAGNLAGAAGTPSAAVAK